MNEHRLTKEIYRSNKKNIFRTYREHLKLKVLKKTGVLSRKNKRACKKLVNVSKAREVCQDSAK